MSRKKGTFAGQNIHWNEPSQKPNKNKLMISRRLLRIKAMHIAFAYFNSGEGSLKFYENELSSSILKFYDLYHAFFSLIVEVRQFAEQRIEQRRNKLVPTEEDLNPNTRFVNNRLLLDLEGMDSFNKYRSTRKIGWQDYPEIVKRTYNSLIESDVYADYIAAPDDSYGNDRQIIYYILEQLLPDNEELYQLLEEQSIYWNDDIELVLSMNIRTVQRMKENKGVENKLMPLYKTDEDMEFVKKLFRRTVVNHERNLELISELSSQWETERFALVDKVLLEMAITELTEFPLIPIQISMNEYIELAKYYSTEKSHVFVNGMLEKAIEKLTAANLIKKVGPGLLSKAEED